ncbi:MAG: BamA/TamA family outer membrane protein [Spirosomaceae bacterium]|nr:BamA/TamA family outer membrane protein [Spirosomataceae bacterium]
MKKSLLIFFFLCLFSTLSFGEEKIIPEQRQVLDSTRNKFLRDKNTIILPIVFRFPETRFGGGIAGTTTFSFSRDSVGAKPSQATFGVTYTQNKQVLVFFPFKAFYRNNDFYINADIGWYKYNYFFYGIGENRVPQETFDVTFPRIKILAAKQVGDRNYVGLRMLYEHYNVTGVEDGGLLASGEVSGGDFSRTSSFGVSVLRDTRDNVFYPRKGIFGEAYILRNAKIFGADRNFTRLHTDIANYQSITKKLVFASNLVGNFLIGDDIPFSQLSVIGGSEEMRGLYQGYFRDKNTLIGQAEARCEVWGRFGVVGFGAVGWMGNEEQLLRFNLPKFTYGAGLRVATKKHLNLRIDYGFSPYEKGTFYATIGEAF